MLVFFIIGTPFFRIEEAAATEGDSWALLTPLPASFYTTIGAAAVDGKIYFVGGNITVKYDPITNTWESIASLPIYNGWGTVVACQNKIYVIGGNSEIPTQVYDPTTDTWANRTSIPTTRSLLQANVVNGKIYVISGQKPSFYGIADPSDVNDVYDPLTDSWSSMSPIPIPVEGYASAVLDNKIYLIRGGTAANVAQNATNQVQIFDPQTNQWTNGTPIPVGVAYARACTTTGLLAPKRIYVIGGANVANSRNTSSFATDLNQVYTPETGNWSVAASLPAPRWKSTLVNVDDELYMIGGFYYSDVLANEKYTPIGYIPEFPLLTTIFIMLIVFTVGLVVCKGRLTSKQPNIK